MFCPAAVCPQLCQVHLDADQEYGDDEAHDAWGKVFFESENFTIIDLENRIELYSLICKSIFRFHKLQVLLKNCSF